LVGWFVGCLVVWLVGWLAGWKVGWLVRSLVSYFFVCLLPQNSDMCSRNAPYVLFDLSCFSSPARVFKPLRWVRRLRSCIL
jgi:hypothetical protein